MMAMDSGTIETLVATLTDVGQAEAPADFPLDIDMASHPGLYSWWADSEARHVIGERLGVSIARLVYSGQAGATRWPSGRKSTATLCSRIQGNHINGNASSSTFRLTISALLLGPLGLTVSKPGKLRPEDRTAVSNWIKDHFQVLIVPYDDRDTLKKIEDAVLEILDPPLNLEGMPSTDSRIRLSSLRRRISRPG